MNDNPSRISRFTQIVPEARILFAMPPYSLTLTPFFNPIWASVGDDLAVANPNQDTIQVIGKT